MDIKSVQALQAYGAIRKPLSDPSASQSNPFQQATESFQETLSAADNIAQQAVSGTADPHALVEALANSQLAVETVVTVRDRVVEAYQEILRMPV